MTIRAELADGRVLEFPDGTSDDVIDRTVRGMVAGGGERPDRLGVAPSGVGPGAVPETIQPQQPQPQPKPKPQGLEELTGGLVSRAGAEMIGGTAGAVLGTGAALASGAGAPFAPAGALGGGALGTAAGSITFDGAENLLKYLGVLEGEPAGPMQQFAQAGESARMDLMFGGLFDVARPIYGTRRGLARILGLSDPKRQQLIKEATDAGLTVMDPKHGAIPAVGAVDVGNQVPKGFAKVLGVFPFVGTPGQRAFIGKQEAVERQMERFLDTFAPTVTTADQLGVNMEKAARQTYKEFRDTAGKLYQNFYREAGEASTKNIIPTKAVKAELVGDVSQEGVERQGILADLAKGEIVLGNGETLPRPVHDAMLEYAEKLKELPEAITVFQYQRLMDDLSRIMDSYKENGFVMKNGARLKGALEIDLNNIMVDMLPEDEAARLKNLLDTANSWFSENITKFQTPTAQRFERVDRNVFSPGRVDPGSLNADQIRDVAINLKSPKSVQDLRELVGDNMVNQAARLHVEDALTKSFDVMERAGQEIRVFNAERFANNLGLEGTKSIRELQGLRELMARSDVDFDQVAKFVEVAGRLEIPRDVSAFMARRVTLGGPRALLAGLGVGAAATAAGGGIGLGTMIAGAGITLLARFGSKVVSDPVHLKLLTAALDDQVKTSVRAQALGRLVRLLDAEESREQEDVPPGVQRENPGIGARRQNLLEQQTAVPR